MANEERPPYVRFARVAVEDRSKLLDGGLYGFRDVDMAFVTRPGQRDTFECEAEPWLKMIEEAARNGQCPMEWPRHFREQYRAWQEGQELPEKGVPIKGWAALSPAMQENLLRLNIRTVEQLAEIDSVAESRIGMGSVTLKQRAQAWLQATAGTAQAAVQIETVRAENEVLKQQLAELRQEVARLAARDKALA